MINRHGAIFILPENKEACFTRAFFNRIIRIRFTILFLTIRLPKFIVFSRHQLRINSAAAIHLGGRKPNVHVV
jgi:hypothetical protein